MNLAYIQAVKSDPDFNTNGRILKKIQDNQQFSYGNVSLEKFSKYHTNDTLEWIGRKITAIPLAAWGCVKLIRDIAFTFFSHLIDAVIDGSMTPLKAWFFVVLRDFEEIGGQLLTLVNDRIGTFLAQEAIFHKGCYLLFSSNPLPLKNNEIKPEYLDVFGFKEEAFEGDLKELKIDLDKRYINIISKKPENSIEKLDSYLSKYSVAYNEISKEINHRINIKKYLDGDHPEFLDKPTYWL